MACGHFQNRNGADRRNNGSAKSASAAGQNPAIGVSNFSRDQLAEALQYGRIDSLQPPYSLFWRSVEQDLMPFCAEQNISILAYSPLAQGLLTGKLKADHQFEEGDIRLKNKLFKGENYDRAQAALDQLRPIAWLIAQPQTSAIVGARNPDQTQQNAAAATVQISPADLAQIDAIGRSVTDHLDDNPVMWNFAA